MASENKTRSIDIKNSLLIVYVAICVLMVVITMSLSFFGFDESAIDLTATSTATLSPAVQTLQADEYQPAEAEDQDADRQVTPDATAGP